MWDDTKYGGLNSSFDLESTEVLTSRYRVKNLPIVKSEIEVVNSVLCASSHLFLIAVTDKKVSIFEEESAELFWEIETNENVCCISLSDDSCLLLIAEYSGKIQLFHIASKTSLWSYTCPDGKSSVIKEAFIAIDSSELLKLFLVSDHRMVYEFSNISVTSIYDAVEKGNLNIFEDVHLKTFNLLEMFPNCDIKYIFQIFGNSPMIGLCLSSDTAALDVEFFCTDDIINAFPEADWEYDADDSRIFHCLNFSAHENVIKAVCTKDGRYVVVLNEKHVLNVICPFTSHTLKTLNVENKCCIKNFVLNETLDPSSSLISDCKIGLLIAPTSGDSGYSIFEIRNFPSFELISSMNLSNFTIMADCNLNQEFWCLMNGEVNLDNSRGHFNNLYLKEIYEASPEARLMSLISRRKFLEAKKLAEIANINSEVIYRTKISCILNSLSMCKNTDSPQAEMDNLWKEFNESFKHITDVNFVQSVVLCPLPNPSSMKNVLLCVKNWVIFNNDRRGSQKIISKVNRILCKLDTYEIICCITNSCLSLKDFLNKDLLNYMISELQKGGLKIACLIWQRHKDDLLVSLDIENIEEILKAIPDSLPSHHIIPFLYEDFLPFLFSKIPECIDMVAEWLCNQIELVEFFEKDLWPENGMDLVAGFLNVIKGLHEKGKNGESSFSGHLSFSSVHKKFVKTSNPVGCLVEFSKDLTWLIKLKSQFNCKVPLSYFQNSKTNVMFTILDDVNVSQIAEIIDSFARPYALEHNLELDFCLEKYVEKTFQESRFTWWMWDAEPWEERLITVTERIHSTNRWVNAALMIVSRASLPWSDRVKKLVQKGIECDCESKDFQMQAKLVGLKEVLLNYEQQHFPINNDANLIHILVKYIYLQNRAEVLEDVKKVLMSVSDQPDEMDIYYKYLQFSINQNKMDQMKKVFLSLSESAALICAKRLLLYIKSYLDNRFLLENNKELVSNMLHTGVFFAEFLKKKKEPFMEEKMQILLKSLLKLQEEFGIIMTFSELSCKSECQAVLKRATEDFLTTCSLLKKVANSSDRKNGQISSCIYRLYRLGDILLFEREEVITFLITSCLEKQKYDLVLQLCKELTTSFSSSNITQVLMEAVDHFYLNFLSIKDVNFGAMVETIYHLSSVAVTYCKEESLEKYMNTVNLTTFLSSIREASRQQSALISPEYAMDSYHRWKYYPFYQDEGFQLDSENVTHFVMMVYGEFVKQPTNRNDTLTEIGFSENDALLIAMKQLTRHMAEKGQGVSAFRTLLYYFHKKCQISVSASDICKVYTAVSQDLGFTTYSIVQNVLSQRRVDSYYAYSLLSVLPEVPQIVSLKSLIKWCLSDLKRLATVSRIGMEVAKSLQNNDALSMFENIYKKAYLLARSNVKSVPVEVILHSSNNGWSVVKDLIFTKEIDIPTLQECCSAFQLPNNDVLIAYLNHILMECEKKTLNNDSTPMEVNQSLEKATAVINSIKDEELLYNNFKLMMKKISPYSYEFLLFIEMNLHSLSANMQTVSKGSFEKNTKILKFLKVYERTSPVSELEICRWNTLYPTNSKLPEIASKRLPFHFFLQENLFSIINPELSVNTLDVWLKIAPVLKMPQDNLIIIAVKNTVLKYLKQHSSPHFIFDPDMKFVDMIDKMISNVKELESSVACASWVETQMPSGGNKVAFASLAVDYAQQWYEQSTNPIIDVYNKLVLLKQHSAVERALYKNNLASEEILSLKQSSSQLIDYLIEEFSLDLDKCVKACKAISEIGDVSNINPIQVYKKFIFKWLNITKGNSTVGNIDESFSPLSPINQELEEDDTDDRNLLRIINLILSMPHSLLEDLLEILQNEFKVMPMVQRSRLLFCFVSIFDVSTASKALEWDKNVLEDNLVPLLSLAESQNLNLPYTHQTFHSCNKTNLVQKILSTNFHDSKAVIFCVQLCLEYSIWDADIWEVILQRLIMKDGKEFHLQGILESVQGHLTHLWHSKAFQDAWKCVLSRIMRNLEDSILQVSKLYKAVLSCPCISSMDATFFINELNYVTLTFEEKGITDLVPITDVSSLVLNLMKIMRDQCKHNDH